jgi:hypothetical protein
MQAWDTITTRGVPQVVGARTLSGGGEKKITLTLRDNER